MTEATKCKKEKIVIVKQQAKTAIGSSHAPVVDFHAEVTRIFHRELTHL